MDPRGIALGIEVKASERWRSRFGRSLNELHGAKKLDKCFAVYTGTERLQHDAIVVLPVKEFMKELGEGRILP